MNKAQAQELIAELRELRLEVERLRVLQATHVCVQPQYVISVPYAGAAAPVIYPYIVTYHEPVPFLDTIGAAGGGLSTYMVNTNSQN